MLLDRRQANNPEADIMENPSKNVWDTEKGHFSLFSECYPENTKKGEMPLWGKGAAGHHFPPLPFSINTEPPAVNSTLPILAA